jgi:hypothetical protein
MDVGLHRKPQNVNAVIHWNRIATEILRIEPGPIIDSRAFAILHAAVHDAVNGIDRRYEPYTIDLSFPGASSMRPWPGRRTTFSPRWRRVIGNESIVSMRRRWAVCQMVPTRTRGCSSVNRRHARILTGDLAMGSFPGRDLLRRGRSLSPCMCPRAPQVITTSRRHSMRRRSDRFTLSRMVPTDAVCDRPRAASPQGPGSAA